ncbi:lipid droplet assembly factor 1 [Talpa occidentalis]|uniref:lipid droplet assembly factor 1 n=1 Tax=Talpa occidentalis TaxID=50954 RepID=UPI00188E72E1|nr:lipid droplet assembly factor 1 [Talpa occidentalis]XP_037363376.1 lipid droplet assembly factor 1 [Talpa occidentalis]
MEKEEPPSASKELQELQRKLSLLMEFIQGNSKVVAFMKSPVGQYLDRHPFLTLAVLVFLAVMAVPLGFFLFLTLLASLAALVGVILLEGLVLSMGGLSLFCILCGLGFMSLAMLGTILVPCLVVSSLINYWFSPRTLTQEIASDDSPQAMKSVNLKGL